MRRFAARIQADRAVFDREETRHMASVLRLAPGDVVIAGDGQGREYTVRLEALGETARGSVLGVVETRRESPLAIALVQGVPKGDRMEQIIRAATELGVQRVLPALTERTVVQLDAGRWRERARRWQRVAREAAKQCGRGVVPDVEEPRRFAAWLDEVADLRLCLWEGESGPLAAALADHGAPASALIAIGPEGGLSLPEVEAARERGWRVAGLGPRILRTETAGPAAVAIVQYRFGDLAGGAIARE
jgi:16S rRNA (uracil1498-N3)-methyltransferase